MRFYGETRWSLDSLQNYFAKFKIGKFAQPPNSSTDSVDTVDISSTDTVDIIHPAVQPVRFSI
jgi:hypothetical protein